MLRFIDYARQYHFILMVLAGGDVNPFPEFSALLHGYVTALHSDVKDFLA